MPQTTMPSPQQSIALFDQLYAERFFQKAAEFGIPVPADVQSQQAMLHTAYQLDSLPEPGVKEAESAGSEDFHLRANEKLALLLQKHGLDVDPQAIAKQAAATEHQHLAMGVITNPELYKAAMVLNNASSE